MNKTFYRKAEGELKAELTELLKETDKPDKSVPTKASTNIPCKSRETKIIHAENRFPAQPSDRFDEIKDNRDVDI